MSHLVDDVYDVYEERRVRARVERSCDACAGPVLRGHTYWRIAIVFDGSARTVHRCERCQAVHVHLRGLGGGEMWPAEKLGRELAPLVLVGEPAVEIAALAFLSPEEAQAAAARESARGKGLRG